MTKGLLRHRLRVLRVSLVDDGFNRVEAWAQVGHAIWAERRDVSDAERLRGGQVAAEIGARFRLRRSALADSITAADRLNVAGVVWQIMGPPKLTGADDRMLEISCARVEP